MDQLVEDQMDLKDFLEEAELQQYYALFRDILKVTKVSQLKFVVTEDLTQIGLSKPEQRRYKKVYSKYFPNVYLMKIKRLLGTTKKQDEIPRLWTDTKQVEVQSFNDANIKVPTKHIISIEDITINKELGMGEFGVVQQGTWTTGNQRVQVAIKCLGQERMTSNSTEFLKEAAVMHSIDHPNIVRLYGVVLHMDSLMLVTELAPLRSLLECLREIPLRSNFPVVTLCEFAEQICDGMTYLENKRLIHRDLAVRNILVFNRNKVKISDFGLSRALGVGKDYYQTNYNVNLKLPVAWCAPECILYLRFTSASDIWAYAVCLWEMFSYGFQPWAGFSGHQILETIDTPNSQRLERPECCPELYYTTMLECWAHHPQNRPKFKDLGPKLRHIRPEQATSNSNNPDGKRHNMLEFNAGDVITVIGKESLTNNAMWFGVLPDGACGLFDPSNTKPYIKPVRAASFSSHSTSSLSPISTRDPGRFAGGSLRPALLRSDVKRHTYTAKRTIHRSMISGPQGDVKHTSHVGLDGAYFGDVSFLDTASCPPKQIVNPYKPSEDLENVPLINPNSPSHMTGGASSTPPYPLLQDRGDNLQETVNLPKGDCDEVDRATNCAISQHRSVLKRESLKSPTESKTSKGLLHKVKSATLGRSFKANTEFPTTSTADEAHEYHEISDSDTVTLSDNCKPICSSNAVPDSPLLKTDFSRSLMDEIELMFKNLDADATERKDDTSPWSEDRSIFDITVPFSAFPLTSIKRQLEQDIATSNFFRSQTLCKVEKKKSFNTSTMKPMSAHEQKTLDTAVALANELTSRSMTDLENVNHKMPYSPNDRSKFHFKFPSLGHSQEVEKDVNSKQERRNFSEEANSVPDIQTTFTEESKLAYTSLIEEPTSSSLIPHIVKDSIGNINDISPHSSLQKKPQNHRTISTSSQPADTNNENAPDINNKNTSDETIKAINKLPLPPRTTDTRLVDRPRHIRKHPLIVPNLNTSNLYNNGQFSMQNSQEQSVLKSPKTAAKIYQNLGTYQIYNDENFDGMKINEPCCSRKAKIQYLNIDAVDGIDVFDGLPVGINPNPDSKDAEDNDKQSACMTNPFANTRNSLTRPVNPFTSAKAIFLSHVNVDADKNTVMTDETYRELKESDHVSVEDLLEFADLKPCGRQRGIESDEVRIMGKVLKQEVTPEACLEALEVTDWDVHLAIKLMMRQSSAS